MIVLDHMIRPARRAASTLWMALHTLPWILLMLIVRGNAVSTDDIVRAAGSTLPVARIHF